LWLGEFLVSFEVLGYIILYNIDLEPHFHHCFLGLNPPCSDISKYVIHWLSHLNPLFWLFLTRFKNKRHHVYGAYHPPFSEFPSFSHHVPILLGAPIIPTYPHHFQTQTPKVAPFGGPQHPTADAVASPAPQSEDLAAPRRSRGGGSARRGPSSGPPCAGPRLPTTGSKDLKIRVVEQGKGDLREFH
jgi:hypothetical protein